jgi:hypothetical protein
MTTGDFPLGKKYNCPDCLLHNRHPDCCRQINFCTSCERVKVNYPIINQEFSTEKLYNEYLELLCDCFNDGEVPRNKKSRIYKIATLFTLWAKNIRDVK